MHEPYGSATQRRGAPSNSRKSVRLNNAHEPGGIRRSAGIRLANGCPR